MSIPVMMTLIGRKVKVAAFTATYLAKEAATAVSRWIPSPKDVEPETSEPIEEPRGAFSLFSELPADLRLRIWASLDLEPCVIVQRKTGKRKPMYRFPRLIPAVLHACRESRYEFLDPNDEKSIKKGLIKKRDHPTYKLYFMGQKRISKPVFFSIVIDSVWGCHCLAKKPISFENIENGATSMVTSRYSGLTVMNIASTLESLVLYADRNIIGILPYFPNLKRLTFLYPTYVFEHRDPRMFYSYGRPILGPEVNGEVNIEGMPPAFRQLLRRDRERIEDQVSRMVIRNPEWTPPLIMFRAVEQYVANEHLNIPLSYAGWRSFE
jgi:hypothetical protein